VTKFIIDKFSSEIKTFTGFIGFALNGHYVIDVPTNVQIDTTVPSFDVTSLITQKFTGLLAGFPEFSDIVFDELEDDSDINAGAAAHFAKTGDFEQILPPLTGKFTTTVFDLTVVTSLGGAPVKFQPHFDFYKLTKTQTSRGNYNVTYTEVSANEITAEISFDNGSSFSPATNDVMNLIGVPDTDMILRFTNTSADEVYVGSWSVMLSDTL